MTLRDAERLERALERKGVHARVFEEYSGRGMFGRTTTAVEVDQFNDLISARQVAGNLGLKGLQTDSLGYGAIIY